MRLLTPEQEQKFWSRVKKTKGCWLWCGSVSPRGYGQYHPSNEQRTSAHRWAWMISRKRQVPKGYFIHHLCHNQLCVRPNHLKAMTAKQHKALHPSPPRFGVDNPQGRKTHCPQGHPYDEVNTGRSKQGKRYCRTCKTEKSRANRERRRRLSRKL